MLHVTRRQAGDTARPLLVLEDDAAPIAQFPEVDRRPKIEELIRVVLMMDLACQEA